MILSSKHYFGSTSNQEKNNHSDVSTVKNTQKRKGNWSVDREGKGKGKGKAEILNQ